MIFMIDNYDSFTYNLVQYLEMLEADVTVRRNDETSLEEIASLNPEALVISPGPGRPSSAGISMDAIRYFAGKIPILGVCLGHQAIGEVFGGKVVHAKNLMHGKTSPVTHDGKGLFEGIPQNFKAMRYHSLAVEAASLPACLEISGRSDDGEIMALRHREYPIESIQYHPESITTVSGKRQLANFLKLAAHFREGRK